MKIKKAITKGLKLLLPAFLMQAAALHIHAQETADTLKVQLGEMISVPAPDTTAVDSLLSPPMSYEWEMTDKPYDPSPTRAVWLSALMPGLGQLYNQRYWKLPIIVGGYMGLGYAVNWNSTMLGDYTQAYRDIMDNDPSTKSYMNLFPPGTKESSIDKAWLTKVLQSRKNYFRRNRDLCIISMVGVYLLAALDAYVDASLAHFDISPDLSLNVSPTLMPVKYGVTPAAGMCWAINF